MNERIRQLLSQAGVHYEVLPKDTVYEKFAELIVQECLAQADALRDSFESEGEDQQSLGAAWVGLAIARHFGVD
jgi:hypothetical protein